MRSLAPALASVFALVAAFGCGSEPVVPEVPKGGDDVNRGPQGHLLLFPAPNAERLLGRAVTRRPEGGFVIADELAPGCEVEVVRERNAVSFAREVDLREASDVGGSYALVASFEARWGKELKARIEAQNEERVRAELRGECGEEVVTEVFVGTGARSVLRSAEVAGEASASVMGVSGGGKTDRSARILDETKWSEPQAYAFTTQRFDGLRGMDVEVRLPSQIVEGDAVEFAVTTSEDAHLVVYYVGADGKGATLLPSNEDPHPATKKGAPFRIPSEPQRAAGVRLQAALLKKGEACKERLLVFAFHEEGDFKLVQGALDEADGDVERLEQLLAKKLANVPARRWKRRSVSYAIEPKR